RRVMLELLEIDAVLGDLAEHLTVGRTGNAEPNGERGAMARHPDHADVGAKILAAELRADAETLRHLQYLLLHLKIAEGIAVRRAVGRQRVEITRGGEFYGFHAEFGRGAADHDRKVLR